MERVALTAGRAPVLGEGLGHSLPVCAACAGAVFGALAQGLVSRTGNGGGGSTGELAAVVTVTLGGGKAGTAPLTGAAGDCGEEAGLGIGAEEKGSSGGPLKVDVI